MSNKFEYKKNERADYLDVNCHWWRCDDGPFDKHSHEDYYEVIIATDGEFINVVGKTNYSQKKGDVVVIALGSEHSITNINDGVHYNIAVKRETFEKMISNKESMRKTLEKQGSFLVTLSPVAYAYVENCINKIDNDRVNAYVLTLVETVLSTVILAFMEKQMEDNLAMDKAYYCRNAIEKMDNDTLVDKKMSEIYATYPMSHTAFIDEFKRIKGVTPNKYLLKRKLDYAKKLLLTSDKSVLEIAWETGYDSVSHFIKKFKMEFGVTPLRFRKTYLKK